MKDLLRGREAAIVSVFIDTFGDETSPKRTRVRASP